MKNIEACTDTIVNDLYSLLKIEGLPIVEISKPRHYWFIRTQGGSYFDEFFLDEFVGIGHEDVPCVEESERTDELLEQVKVNHPQATRVLNQVYKFCKEMRKGDIVIIPSASSAQFAFGYIEDDDYYKVKVSDEDIDEGKCPYTRRRKTHWIRGISKGRVDSKLYTFFRNQQTLSMVDDYSEFIERAIHPFYVKDDIAHLTLDIRTPESPNAFDIPTYMQGILYRAKEIAQELKLPSKVVSVQSRTNVQSAGLIELLGNPVFVALAAIIFIGICGGELNISVVKNAKVTMKTDGLIESITHAIEKYKNHEIIGESNMKKIQGRLRVEDPRIKKEDQD